MQITRLRVSGFKSFSDPTDILIEAGLTGIVGPNGCGKSNIVEALRWVMGESSARGLRGEEMEDVIFNGSAARAAFDMAEVGLKLRGRIAGLAGFGDHDEIEVSRRLGRGIGSLYRINGREARARDVQLLFADAGAGARSAAIVGQGQIGFIVDARPQDRRRLLEDAAGIGGLHGRRREAELRLQSTEQNLARIVDLLQGQEKRLAELVRQNRQAERYRQLAAEIRGSEALLLLARWVKARGLLAEAERTLAAAQATGERAGSDLASLRAARDEQGRAVETLRASAAELAARIAALAERVSAQAGERERRAGELAGLRRRETEVEADQAEVRAAQAEALERRRRLDAEQEALGAGDAALRAEAERLEAEIALAAATLAGREQAAGEAVANAAGTEARFRALSGQLAVRRRRSEEVERLLAQLGEDPAGEPGTPTASDAARALAVTLVSLADAEARARSGRSQREAAEHGLATLESTLAAAREVLGDHERRWREHETRAALLAERERAAARQEERLTGREAALADRVAAHAAGLAALDHDGACSRVRLTADALAAARAHHAGAAQRSALATERAQAADAARAALASELGAVAAERQVLVELLPEASATALVDRLAVEEGYADALAAALGDDLLAGTAPDEPVFWHEDGLAGAAEPAADPALPEGVAPLVHRVQAPPALARRLAQIGVVEPALAAALQPCLAPGQRLASRCGGLWRWDGLVRSPDSANAAAARLRQRRRHDALVAREAVLRERLAAAEADAADATAAAAEALTAHEAARSEVVRAERAADEAGRQRERTEQAAAALEREARELAQDAEHLAHERAELMAEQRAAASARPDEQVAVALRAALEQARSGLRELERQAREQIAARRAAEQALAEAERRIQDLRTLEERQRGAVELARESESREALARATRAAELKAQREALEAELCALAAAVAEDEDEVARAGSATRERLLHRRQAEDALTAARATHADLFGRERAARDAMRRHDERRRAIAGELAELAARADATGVRLNELENRRQRLAEEVLAAASALAEAGQGAEGLAAELERVEAERARAAAELIEAEGRLAGLGRRVAAAEEAAGLARERLVLARAERARAAEALGTAAAAVTERLHHPPEALLADPARQAEVERSEVAALDARLARLKASRDRLGPVNLRADAELAELQMAVEVARGEEAELRAAVDRLKRAIATINREGRERLLAVFEQVDTHFRRLFVRLFGGGKAHLRLTDTDDPLAAGLELEASPPGKRLASISLLSGGEKTLTALALVFALFLAQPAPLCVLDEVDAPLDDANVDRFVALMDEIAAGTLTRFLVVTHHPLTMARMHRLYGVTMLERGVSRLVSVALDEAVELRATA